MTDTIVFWDVDTQHDFMDPDGRLAVPGAAGIVPNLARLTRVAAARGIPIVATADAHPVGDPEFDAFGEHCVVGTPGQQRIDATRLPACEVAGTETAEEQVARLMAGDLQQLVIEKVTLDVFDVPVAERVLQAAAPDRIVVYGVATEYCVRAEVLSMLARGCAVTVLTDAVKGIDPDAEGRALSEMAAAGASLSDTETVLAGQALSDESDLDSAGCGRT